jgi:hypothetical protein
MTTDDEFVRVVKLVAAFSLETETPFWKNVGEVATSFTSPHHCTLLAKDVEGKLVGYLHGYLLGPREFIISQAYHRHGENNLEAFQILEAAVKERGVTKLLALTPLDPRMFEKYGLSFERFLLTKYL